MERKRQAGYITKQSSSDFGLEVKVQRTPLANVALPPSGDPFPEGSTGLAPQDTGRNRPFRRPIPPGQIGSEEGNDPMVPSSQYVSTQDYDAGEVRPASLHGSVAALRSADTEMVPFQAFDSFQPRSAPIPRARQNDGTLGTAPYQADPLMIDEDSSRIIEERNANTKDLYGPNRAGFLHNDNHPGFAAEQSKIVGKEGISSQAAGAILASATRKASPAAKKANPHLKKVK